ncbi:hypothetical protein [Methanoregula sp.]|uniref:hypothetical protein n=1 Tax=Methanoregula sp. TaxID=2052170 RepID=UPI00262EE085|nr:hypothetical protein [Methanoregula sp.]MDD5142378.1 hypothetical protein [Methanoregula sp.]
MQLGKLNILLLALLVAAMVMIPCVSAVEEQQEQEKMIQADPKTDLAGYVPVDILSIDPSVKAATPYYYLLVLSDEGKKHLLDSIDAAEIIGDSGITATPDEKVSFKKSLKTLWMNYPVVSKTVKGSLGYPSYGGTVTTLTFSPSLKKEVHLSDAENSLLAKVQSRKQVSSDKIASGGVSPKWAGSPTHERISYWAASKESFPQPSTVSANAPVPDTWPAVLPEPFCTLYRSLNHYYSPNTGTGNAPSQTATYISAANSQYKAGSSYYTQAATSLGYASHFLEDVGNPMHTGKETEQYSNPWVHFNYEAYVGDRWYSSNFDTVVSNNNNYYWYTDWAAGNRALAGYSNGYLDTIYTKVYNKGQNWNLSQDTSIDAITQNLVLATAKYTNGLALYARIG